MSWLLGSLSFGGRLTPDPEANDENDAATAVEQEQVVSPSRHIGAQPVQGVFSDEMDEKVKEKVSLLDDSCVVDSLHSDSDISQSPVVASATAAITQPVVDSSSLRDLRVVPMADFESMQRELERTHLVLSEERALRQRFQQEMGHWLSTAAAAARPQLDAAAISRVINDLHADLRSAQMAKMAMVQSTAYEMERMRRVIHCMSQTEMADDSTLVEAKEASAGMPVATVKRRRLSSRSLAAAIDASLKAIKPPPPLSEMLLRADELWPAASIHITALPQTTGTPLPLSKKHSTAKCSSCASRTRTKTSASASRPTMTTSSSPSSVHSSDSVEDYESDFEKYPQSESSYYDEGIGMTVRRHPRAGFQVAAGSISPGPVSFEPAADAHLDAAVHIANITPGGPLTEDMSPDSGLQALSGRRAISAVLAKEPRQLVEDELSASGTRIISTMQKDMSGSCEDGIGANDLKEECKEEVVGECFESPKRLSTWGSKPEMGDEKLAALLHRDGLYSSGFQGIAPLPHIEMEISPKDTGHFDFVGQTAAAGDGSEHLDQLLKGQLSADLAVGRQSPFGNSSVTSASSFSASSSRSRLSSVSASEMLPMGVKPSPSLLVVGGSDTEEVALAAETEEIEGKEVEEAEDGDDEGEEDEVQDGSEEKEKEKVSAEQSEEVVQVQAEEYDENVENVVGPRPAPRGRAKAAAPGRTRAMPPPRRKAMPPAPRTAPPPRGGRQQHGEEEEEEEVNPLLDARLQPIDEEFGAVMKAPTAEDLAKRVKFAQMTTVASRQVIEIVDSSEDELVLKTKPKTAETYARETKALQRRIVLLEALRSGKMLEALEDADEFELSLLMPVICCGISLLPFGMSAVRKQLIDILLRRFEDELPLLQTFTFFLNSYRDSHHITRLIPAQHPSLQLVNATPVLKLSAVRSAAREARASVGCADDSSTAHRKKHSATLKRTRSMTVGAFLRPSTAGSDESGSGEDHYAHERELSVSISRTGAEDFKEDASDFLTSADFQWDLHFVYDGSNPIEFFRLPLLVGTETGSVSVPIETHSGFYCPMTRKQGIVRLEIVKIYKSNAKPLLIHAFQRKSATDKMATDSMWDLEVSQMEIGGETNSVSTPMGMDRGTVTDLRRFDTASTLALDEIGAFPGVGFEEDGTAETERKFFETEGSSDEYVSDVGAISQTPCSAFILKHGDDLRKDAAVLQMFRFMNALWHESHLYYNSKPIQALTYQTVAVGADYGLIELIGNCATLKELTDDKPLCASMFSDSEPLYQLIATCAGSYMAAYLMGIRDRHYDNVLIVTSAAEDCGPEFGTVFHIDFGYLLGDKVTGLDTAKFAITAELAKIMGKRYAEFVEISTQAFMALRRAHVELLDYARVVFAFLYPAEAVDDFLRQTLLMHKSDERAREIIKRRLNTAPKKFKTKMKNLVHGLAALKLKGSAKSVIPSPVPSREAKRRVDSSPPTFEVPPTEERKRKSLWRRR